jgi:hypothetical protein
MVPRT